MREIVSDIQPIQSQLLQWYDQNKRSMPWRDAPTPYAVLMSELMLQQTRVDTVIPYFNRFMARWPSLDVFAEADEEDVVSEWAGLGYYSRARNLLKAAKAAKAMGGLPNTVPELLKLPGVGPYTAGAIASIAFQVPAPLVDGNVERVLCRVDGRRGDPRSKDNRKAIWARAEALVPADRPGDFNQSLMELGATVCTPKSPRCEHCPVQANCQAFKHDLQAVLPEKLPKKKPKRALVYAGVVWQSDALLMGRRPNKGLLAGMWELPGIEMTADDTAQFTQALSERLGVVVTVGEALGTVQHVFTHRKQSTVLFEVNGNWSTLSGDGWYTELRWMTATELDTIGMSTLATKTIKVARKNREGA